MPRHLIADCLNCIFEYLEDKNILFSQLKTLKFLRSFQKLKFSLRFLEINGTNLIDLYIPENLDNTLNLANS
uniref:Uncharacterized protein n=1 Tax=Rhizophagus irregularis (strain DAOM 181602 / DAOM 197198 / MUCL 43194) TaxID=747089 RepID=U9SMN1_RHIID